MLKEFRKGFGGGEAPEVFFPGGNQLADFLIGLEGVLEAGTDMTSVDTGDPGGVGVIGSRKISQRLGKNSRGIGTAGWLSFFHEVLQAPTKDGQDGEGSVRKEKITQDLEPDDDKFYGVLPLKGLGIANEREGAAGGEGLVKGVIRLDLPQGCFEASRQAGEFIAGTVADAEDDNAGREPGSVPPLGVGFGVEAEVYPEINVGNDGPANFAFPPLGRTDFRQGSTEVFPSLGRIGWVAGSGAAGGEAGGSGGQAFGRIASTAFQSTKLRNSSM